MRLTHKQLGCYATASVIGFLAPIVFITTVSLQQQTESDAGPTLPDDGRSPSDGVLVRADGLAETLATQPSANEPIANTDLLTEPDQVKSSEVNASEEQVATREDAAEAAANDSHGHPLVSSETEEAASLVVNAGETPEYLKSREISESTDSASNGDPEAMTVWAWRLANHIGVERDLRRAAEWYRRAAELGNARAMYRYADAIAVGWLGAANAKEAAQWKKQAAEAGFPLAIVAQAAQRFPNEPSLLQTAAENGSVSAMLWLNTLPGEEQGKWFERALATAQDPQRTLELDEYYALGTWCEKEGSSNTKYFEHAIDLYRRGAVVGDATAAYQMGRLYPYAMKVKDRYKLQIQSYQRSATLGSVPAAEYLADVYKSGASGVSENRTTAAEWSTKARNMTLRYLDTNRELSLNVDKDGLRNGLVNMFEDSASRRKALITLHFDRIEDFNSRPIWFDWHFHDSVAFVSPAEIGRWMWVFVVPANAGCHGWYLIAPLDDQATHFKTYDKYALEEDISGVGTKGDICIVQECDRLIPNARYVLGFRFHQRKTVPLSVSLLWTPLN